MTSESEVVVNSAPLFSRFVADLPGVDRGCRCGRAPGARARSRRRSAGRWRGGRLRPSSSGRGRSRSGRAGARGAPRRRRPPRSPSRARRGSCRSSSEAMPGRLLSPMLEGIETEVGEVGGVLRIADPEDSAFVGEALRGSPLEDDLNIGDARIYARPRAVSRNPGAPRNPLANATRPNTLSRNRRSHRARSRRRRLAVFSPCLAADDAPVRLSERERAIHVLNRLAFGPRPGDVDRVAAMGVDRWIERQLHPERVAEDPPSRRGSREIPTLSLSTAALIERFEQPLREAKKAAARRRGRRPRRRRRRRRRRRAARLRGDRSRPRTAPAVSSRT